MEANHIPLIMERLDKIVSEDRMRKFPSRIIVKIIVILQVYGISYRSSCRFFNNHPELMNLVGIGKIPDFRTLSYRALGIDWHEINAGIIDLIESNVENAAIDSFIAKTCRYATAQRRRKSGKYKDPESSWGYGTKGFEYGRKTHVAQDIDSPALGEWKATTASLHDSIMAFPMIDAVRDHEYILMDAAYNSAGIYDYILDNTHVIPVIDTNRRRGIVPDNLTFSRKQGIIIRDREKARYRLRWEIERTFSILEEILHSEHIWYVRNRNYDVAVGERIVAYNCIVLVNQIGQRSKREIMDLVV
jgi:hypothetical protein